MNGHARLTLRDTGAGSPKHLGMSSGYGDGVDTEAGMLPGISRKRSIRSNPYWFTEFCNSQCLSHFAAPFIVVRAETSVAESCDRKQQRLRWSPKRTSSKEVRSPWQPTRGSEGTQAPLAPRGAALEFRSGNQWPERLSPSRIRQDTHHSYARGSDGYVRMILPQVHLRKPCYDFSFL